jgi:hypothetical protein
MKFKELPPDQLSRSAFYMRSLARLQTRAGASRHVLRIRIPRITKSNGSPDLTAAEMAASTTTEGSLRDEDRKLESVNQGETACLSHPEVLIF